LDEKKLEREESAGGKGKGEYGAPGSKKVKVWKKKKEEESLLGKQGTHGYGFYTNECPNSLSCFDRQGKSSAE
jgi:hypothetical protein